MVNKESIVDEIHKVRQDLLEESGGSLASLVERLRTEQSGSGRTIRETRRTKKCTEVAEPVEHTNKSPSANR